MSGSQTIRVAARELYGEMPDAPRQFTDEDYNRLFDLIDRLTNDEQFSKQRHKAEVIRAKAAVFEQDTALEEFLGYFTNH